MCARREHFAANLQFFLLISNPLHQFKALHGQTDSQVAASWTCEETCVGWPNGKKTCIDLRANLTSTKVIASHRKSTQVQARPGQTESQVDPSFQLATTCESVWPGLKTFSLPSWSLLLLKLPYRDFMKLRRLLQRQRQIKIKLCVRVRQTDRQFIL